VMTVLSPLSLASLHAMQYEVSASVPCREAVSLKIVGMIHPLSDWIFTTLISPTLQRASRSVIDVR
jgi:hypothetical protein